MLRGACLREKVKNGVEVWYLIIVLQGLYKSGKGSWRRTR